MPSGLERMSLMQVNLELDNPPEKNRRKDSVAQRRAELLENLGSWNKPREGKAANRRLKPSAGADEQGMIARVSMRKNPRTLLRKQQATTANHRSQLDAYI
jgi:hypothetical protein